VLDIRLIASDGGGRARPRAKGWRRAHQGDRSARRGAPAPHSRERELKALRNKRRRRSAGEAARRGRQCEQARMRESASGSRTSTPG